MSAHTPGPWTACRMTHEERGDDLTPEEIGEYVKNSVIKSAAASGSSAFLFISAEKPDGPADVCHVGNGPTSPANAHLIAAAPDLLNACRCVSEWVAAGEPCPVCWTSPHKPTCPIVAAIAKAEGR